MCTLQENIGMETCPNVFTRNVGSLVKNPGDKKKIKSRTFFSHSREIRIKFRYSLYKVIRDRSFGAKFEEAHNLFSLSVLPARINIPYTYFKPETTPSPSLRQ